MAIFVIYFLQTRLNNTGSQAAGTGSMVMGIIAVLITVVSLPAGWLSDRFGNKKLAMTSGWLASLGTLVVVGTTNLAWVIAGGCLIGLAAGLFYPSSWALGAGLVPPESASKYLGIQNLAAAGAGAVGAYIGGPVADYYGLNFPAIPGLGYMILYAIFGLLCLLSAVALRGVQSK